MHRTAALLALVIAPFAAAQPPAAAKKPASPTLEVRLTDGSRIILSLLDEAIPVQTPHGRLLIPLSDIRRIEFGARLPEDVQKKIDAAIAELGSTELARREAAGEQLVRIGPRAYPAVLRATKSSNRDLAVSARRLREKFFDAFPEQRLPQHDLDVITTDEARIAGRIEIQGVRVMTPQFGEKTLKLVDIASVRANGVPAVEDKVSAEPDPGSLTNFAQQTGKSFYFTVTGNNSGSIYGSDLYTTDSSLATAAVHAGLLRVGQTGIIKVTIEPGASAFEATTRHGVTSYGWGAYPSAYRIRRVGSAEEPK